MPRVGGKDIPLESGRCEALCADGPEVSFLVRRSLVINPATEFELVIAGDIVSRNIAVPRGSLLCRILLEG